MIQSKSYSQQLSLKPSKSSHQLLPENVSKNVQKLNLKDVKVAGDDDECDIHLSDREQDNNNQQKLTYESQKIKIISSNEKKRTNGFQTTEDELVLKGSPFISKLTSQAKSEDETLQLTEKNLKNHQRNFSAFMADKENIQVKLENNNDYENEINKQKADFNNSSKLVNGSQQSLQSKKLQDISQKLQNQLLFLQEQPENIETKKSSSSSFISKKSQQYNAENNYKIAGDSSFINLQPKDKMKKMADDAQEKERKECTFTPKINNYGTQRSVQEFLDLQNQFQTYVTQKKKQLKQQQDDIIKSQFQQKPKILKKSKNIAENKADNTIPVYARLYYMHRKQKDVVVEQQKQQQYQIPQNPNNQTMNIEITNNTNINKDNTFRPNIHAKSKSLIRYEKIEDILYKDAQRRQEKAKSTEKQQKSSRPKSINQKHISQYSEKLLIQRFIKEFDLVLKDLFKNALDNPSEANELVIDLASLFEVMIKMGFIKYKENQSSNNNNTGIAPILENEKRLVFLLWNLAGGEKFKGLLKVNLCAFLLSVLGLNWEEKKQNDSNNDPSFDQQLQQQQMSQNISVGQFDQKSSQQQLSQEMQLQQHQSLNTFGPNNNINDGCTVAVSPSQNMGNDKQKKQQQQLMQTAQQNLQNAENNANKDNINNNNNQFENFTQLIKSKSSENLKTMREYLILKSNRLASNNNKQSSFLKSQQNNNSNSMLSPSKSFNTLLQLDPIQNLCNLQLGTFDQQGHWILSEEDQKVIHVAFELLYRNRLTYEELRVNKHNWDYSFHPEISQTSRDMANQYRERALEQAAMLLDKNELEFKVPENGKISHSELLVLLQKKSELSIEKKKNDIINQQLQECSFHPNILQIQPQSCISFNKNQQQQQQVQQQQNYFNNQDQLKQKEKKINNNNNNSFIKNNNYNKNSNVNTNNNNISFTKNINTSSNNNISDQGNKKSKYEELYALAKPRNNKLDKKTEDIEYERNADECTFKPNIQITQYNMKKQNGSHNINQQKQVEKTIERMRSAKQGQDYINTMKEKGHTMTEKDWKKKSFTSSNNQQQNDQSFIKKKPNQLSNGKQYETCRNVSQQKSIFENSTFSANLLDNSQYSAIQQNNIINNNNQINYNNQYNNQQLTSQFQSTNKKEQIQNSNMNEVEQEQDLVKMSDCSSNPNNTQPQDSSNSDERLPLLFVDVNLGPNKTERIVVYEGDKSEDLANKFAQSHCLDEATKLKFKELLDNQIASLLSKIEEEQVEQLSYEEQYNKQIQ